VVPAASSFDPDAQAFITAAAITDPTQQTAIDNLVIGLKADGLWTNMQAIYPLVGGTASSHKWNLKDPRDLDAAYRLAFFGGWTHNSNGITGNGANTYADTFYNSPNSFGTYIRTFNASYPWLTGVNEQLFFGGDFSSEQYTHLLGNQLVLLKSSSSANIILGGPFNKLYSLVDSPVKLYRNGINTDTPTFTAPFFKSVNFVLGALRIAQYDDGVFSFYYVTGYGAANMAFAYFSSSSLNATQNTNLNNRVVAFQTALSRQV
jgi:hypothetical protein